jgi:polyhydroxybutyrate depolymerase
MKTRTIVGVGVTLLVGLPITAGVVAVAGFYALMSHFAANQISGAISVSGERREYLLHVPAHLDSTRPVPLVISLHGAALWPGTQMEVSQWNRVADENGFIVVYPAGTDLSGSGAGMLPFRAWVLGPKSSNVPFIETLIDTISATHRIDADRIFVNGFSNGGAMTFAVSCRLSSKIAAVGTVAAAHDIAWSWCGDSSPMPVISFHGTADHLVPYDGGRPWTTPRPFPSVLAWTALWARRNRCAAEPLDSVVALDVTRREYVRCADGAAVVLYTVRGAGHTWPGGRPLSAWLVGTTTRSIDASREMWRFFQDHPRRRRSY